MIPGLPPLRVIERIELSGESDIDFTSIDTKVRASTRHLALVSSVRSTRAVALDGLAAEFNGNSGARYNRQTLDGAGASPSASRTNAGTNASAWVVPGSSASAGVFAPAVHLITHFDSAAAHTTMLTLHGAADSYIRAQVHRYANTPAAVTQIRIFSPSATDLAIGSVIELCEVDEDYAVKGAESILTSDGTFSLANIGDLVTEGDIILIGLLRTDRAAANDLVDIEFNADATAGNYFNQLIYASGSSSGAGNNNSQRVAICAGDTATANSFGALICHISTFGRGVNQAQMVALSGYHASTSNSGLRIYAQRRENVERITSIEVSPSLGTNFKTGSMLSAYHVPKRLIAYAELEVDTASVTFSNIDQTFQDLRLAGYVRTDVASPVDRVSVEINSDSTAANYDSQYLQGEASTATAVQNAATQLIGNVVGGTEVAGEYAALSAMIPQYAKTDRHKDFASIVGRSDRGMRGTIHRWQNASAITSIVLTPSAGTNFEAGTIFMLEAILPVGGEALQHKPTVETHVDWGDDGDFSAAIDDISSDVRWWSSFTGVSAPAQPTWRSIIGKASVRLKNADGKYNSFNSASALFGNILPRRKVRIRQTTPVVRPMFVGYLEAITPLGNRRTGREAVLTALGPGIALNNRVRIAQKTALTTDAAVTAVLDELSWPSADRDLETGKTTMTRWWADDTLAINAIRELEATEGGWFRETKDGKFAFENREHRLTGARLISQAEYSDDPADSLHYTDIPQQDPIRSIFNDIRSPVTLYRDDPGGVSVLWTHPEANTDATPVAPEILAGETLTVWAKFPNENAVLSGTGFAVSSWVDPLVATTDYLANSQANGAGTNRTANVTVTITASSESAKITIRNDLASDSVFLTKLQARGTALQRLDPVTMFAFDQASVDLYDLRTYPRPSEARWVPTTAEAQGWANAQLGIYKDPQPILGMRVEANASLLALVDATTRRVSDRITVEADGSFLTMGINQDVFIENIRQRYTPGRHLVVDFMLSDAASRSGFWVLGSSALGSDTRPYY